MANPIYGSGPLRSREGLTSRQTADSDEIQLQIDPVHGDLDDHISGLRGKIRKLKGVAQEIESEAKYQKDFVSQLVWLRDVGVERLVNTVERICDRSREVPSCSRYAHGADHMSYYGID